MARTAEPMVARTAEPMVARTAEPMVARTAEPTVARTAEPTVARTAEPTVARTAEPTVARTAGPTVARTVGAGRRGGQLDRDHTRSRRSARRPARALRAFPAGCRRAGRVRPRLLGPHRLCCPRPTQLPSPYTDLLDADAIDELVSERGLRTPFLRVAKGGSTLSESAFTAPGGVGAGVADQVSDDKLVRLFADGSTLVLQGLHRVWPPIIALCQQLATELGHPVQANAYVTPPQNQGFSNHYDVHDVFVLQIAGEKRWQIHAPVLESPLRDQPWNDRRAAVERRAQRRAADRDRAAAGRLPLPPPRLPARRQGAGRSQQPPHHRCPQLDPVTRWPSSCSTRPCAQSLPTPAVRTSLPLGVDLDRADLLPR